MSDTGTRIQARRVELGLSRRQLAERLETSRVRVWRIETGVTPIYADELGEWAQALETTAEQLVTA